MPARRFGWIALVLSLPWTSSAQLRVMTYNVTNYAGGRVNDLQTALFGDYQGRHARPDLFLGQEFISASALSQVVSLMNSAPGSPGDYSAAAFVDGPDTDSVFVYRRSKVVLDGTRVVSVGGSSPNQPRNIMRYDIHLVGYSGAQAHLSLYSSHMKAGTTADDQTRRLTEAQRVRDDAQTLGHPFLIGGDFNIQSSSESSFVELTGSQANNSGRFFDPIKTPGTWHNTSSLRFVHTQDPTSGQAGMDDRFDLILLSQSLVDGNAFDYLGNPNVAYSPSTWDDSNHSYRAWGNDGTSFNQSLTVNGNQMVGTVVAQALVNSPANQSGHIPVFLDLVVPPKATAPVSVDMGTVFKGQPASTTFQVGNGADVALWSQKGIAPLLFTLGASPGFSVAGGQQSVGAGAALTETLSVDTSVAGLKTGTVTLSSNDPDTPSLTFSVRARVVDLGLAHGSRR